MPSPKPADEREPERRDSHTVFRFCFMRCMGCGHNIGGAEGHYCVFASLRKISGYYHARCCPQCKGGE